MQSLKTWRFHLWYTGLVVERYKRKPNVLCLVCGLPIYRRPAVIKSNSGNVFCSQTCYGLSTRKESPCVVCKTPILASANKITCSRSCANKHRAGIQYKINQPRNIVRDQRSLKQKLLQKRGTICERCRYNKIQEILVLHHKNRDRTNNTTENLEILCPNCHAEEHYGKEKKLGIL